MLYTRRFDHDTKIRLTPHPILAPRLFLTRATDLLDSYAAGAAIPTKGLAGLVRVVEEWTEDGRTELAPEVASRQPTHAARKRDSSRVSFLRGSSEEGRGPKDLLENESMPDFCTNGNVRTVQSQL